MLQRKAIGRYVYGGKFYAGNCSHCQQEFYLTKEKAQQFIENCWFKPKKNLLSSFIFKITTFFYF